MSCQHSWAAISLAGATRASLRRQGHVLLTLPERCHQHLPVAEEGWMVGVQGRAWSTSLYRSQLVCIHGAGLWDEDLLKIALQGAAFRKKK